MKKITQEQILMLELFIAMILWGGSWSATKIIIDYAPIDVLAFWRFLCAFLAFVPLILIAKVPLIISMHAWFIIFIASLVHVLYTYLFFTGLKVGYAGAGGVLVTTLIPIMTYILLTIVYRRKIHVFEIIGLILGVVSGFFLLSLYNPATLLQNGNMYFIASAFTWAVFTLLLQSIKDKIHPISTNLYINLISMFVYYTIAYDDSSLFLVFSFDIKFWCALLFISCFSITIANTLYYRGIVKLGTHRVSSFNLLVPINALLLSWWILGEKPTFNTIIGGLIAIVAIYFVNHKTTNKKTIK